MICCRHHGRIAGPPLRQPQRAFICSRTRRNSFGVCVGVCRCALSIPTSVHHLRCCVRKPSLLLRRFSPLPPSQLALRSVCRLHLWRKGLIHDLDLDGTPSMVDQESGLWQSHGISMLLHEIRASKMKREEETTCRPRQHARVPHATTDEPTDHELTNAASSPSILRPASQPAPPAPL